MLRVRIPFALVLACTLPLSLSACGEEAEGDDSSSGGDEGILTTSPSTSGEGEAETELSSDEGDTDCPPGGCLDIMTNETMADGGEGSTGGDCDAPEHQPCDDDASNIINAMGLNCPGEPIVNATVNGNPLGSGTLVSYGSTGAYAPTEGSRYAVIGTGYLTDLPSPNGCTGTDLGADVDPGTILPTPVQTTDVGNVTCTDNPSLIGSGDCSNTIEAQFVQAISGAFDYTEIRFDVQVPTGVTSFSYDFAFLSTEYPVYYGSQFNDMYIGWLESEQWTGNISFDDQGNPISLNAGFMDYLDADAAAHPDCPTGTNCTAPELDGTCMDGHGATRWLSTQASVTPGESITVVFAVFDMGDSILDSHVFLDNFLWGCEGGQPPSTTPID